jgi:hypothetical protein
MMKRIWIAVGFFLPLRRLSATVAAGAVRAMGSAAGRLAGLAAIETDGILADMLLFSPGAVRLEPSTATYYLCKVLDMMDWVQMDQRTT